MADAYLSRERENIIVSVNQEEKFRIPALNLQAIVSFGYAGCSPGLMQLCVEREIDLSFLSPNGRFMARICGPVRGNVLLRRLQHETCSDPLRSLPIASAMIAAKIHNQRQNLLRHQRDNGKSNEIESAADKLKHSMHSAYSCLDFDTLRGVEGLAAKTYFETFNSLVLHQRDTFSFTERSKHPPKDPINLLLSFAYSLMTNEITSALECVGLDPYVGVFHTLRPGRVSLGVDVVEEFRSSCERFVLSLVNRKQIQSKHFKYPSGEVPMLTDEGRKIFLTAWQTRKKDTITHPFLNLAMPIGLLPHIQAQLLARAMRGEIDTYPPFIIK